MRPSMSPLSTLATSLVLAVGGLAACTDDDGAERIVEDRQVDQCNATFSVDVTSGPEAGFHASGALALYPVGGGALMGVLADPRGPIGVVGSQTDQQLMLSFTLADGRTIVGVGPAPGTSCAGMREGIAVGPSLDPTFSPSAPGTSVGHWLAANLTLTNVDYVLETEGGITSSSFDFEDSRSAQVSCTGANGVTYDYTCRDGNDPIRDRIAHLFGVPYCSEVRDRCASGGGSAGPVQTAS